MLNDAESLTHELAHLKWKIAHDAANENIRISAAVESERRQLDEARRKLVQTQDELAEREAHLEQELAVMSREREALLEQKFAAVSREREALLEQKFAAVSREREALLEQKFAAVSREREALLEQKFAAVSREREALFEQKLAAVSREREAQGKELETMRSDLKLMTSRCGELEAALRAVRTECDTAKRALSTIENAMFWRITWPFRRTLDLLKYYSRRFWQAVKPKSVYWDSASPSVRIALFFRLNELMKRVCPYAYYRHKMRIVCRQAAVPPQQQADASDAQVPACWQSSLWQGGKSAGNRDPLVTVIVPNYNHAPYLCERLESIYSQTYRNFEVILLDDASSDESRRILKRYARCHADRTRVIFNEKNSGSPFAQWRKGIQAAKGDLIWIAESDDWCDLNFLETLVPEFYDEAVKLAFSRTTFMRDGKEVWRIEDYLHDIGKGIFNVSFCMSAHRIVRHFFSKKNIIPNVSSCVFRNPRGMVLLENAEWNAMRVCGDWVFYLHLIRGGAVAYNVSTTNYYRQHNANTSVNLQKRDRFYHEHALVAEQLARNYALSEEELTWMREDLRRFWQTTRTDYSREAYEALFPLDRVLALRAERLPNVIICGFAFSTGGGEQVPIDQANALVRAGLSVTFFDCGGAKRNEAIRRRLSPSIPVVSLDWDYSRVYRLLDQCGAEIVHTHHASVDFAIAVNKPEPVRQVVTLHGMYETVPQEYLKVNVPILNEKVSTWLFIANKNCAILRANGITKDNFIQIFNAVPPVPSVRTRQEVFRECGFPETAKLVVLASRAIDGKGWPDALSAVERARARLGARVDLRIVFVGDGPVYEQMKNRECEWVHFVGYSSDVASYMAAADFVTLPSTYAGESFPLCILEAFRAGRPVVASAIGEIREMMRTDSGTAGVVVGLDPAGRVEEKSLVDAYVAMAEGSDAYARAVRAVQMAERKYSMEVLVRKLISVYQAKG